MAMVSFPDGSYLELIATQAQAPPNLVESHTWSSFLTGNAGPCAWAVRTDDLDAESRRLRSAGIAVFGPLSNGRMRPRWSAPELADRNLRCRRGRKFLSVSHSRRQRTRSPRLSARCSRQSRLSGHRARCPRREQSRRRARTIPSGLRTPLEPSSRPTPSSGRNLRSPGMHPSCWPSRSIGAPGSPRACRVRRSAVCRIAGFSQPGTIPPIDAEPMVRFADRLVR